MKNRIAVLIVLFSMNVSLSYADCSAPDLSLRKHSGLLHGFKVTKIWFRDDVDKKKITGDTVIKFGDYYFLLAPENTTIKPVKLDTDVSKIEMKLLDSFKSSEHYHGTEEQIFSVHDISIYDLTGDKKADLILYLVSPGANMYSGAVGIVNDEWVMLIKPMCF